MLTSRLDVVEPVVEDEVDGEPAEAESDRVDSSCEVAADGAAFNCVPAVGPPDDEVQPAARAIATVQTTRMPILNPAIAPFALGHRRFRIEIHRLVGTYIICFRYPWQG